MYQARFIEPHKHRPECPKYRPDDDKGSSGDSCGSHGRQDDDDDGSSDYSRSSEHGASRHPGFPASSEDDPEEPASQYSQALPPPE